LNYCPRASIRRWKRHNLSIAFKSGTSCSVSCLRNVRPAPTIGRSPRGRGRGSREVAAKPEFDKIMAGTDATSAILESF
jgi:hypothetical protein